jgi:uncharacterized membrane protein HdeD (DUF308 family)
MTESWVAASGPMVLIRGVIAVVFGIIAIVWPANTAVVLVVIWGFWALFDGISLLSLAFRGGSTGARIAVGLLGVVALVAAFFAFVRPDVTAAVLTWLLGIWLVVRAVFEVVSAFAPIPGSLRGLLLLEAAIDLLLGILFMSNPGAGVVGIATFLGILAVLWGAILLVAGLTMRGEEQPHTPAAGSAVG